MTMRVRVTRDHEAIDWNCNDERNTQRYSQADPKMGIKHRHHQCARNQKCDTVINNFHRSDRDRVGRESNFNRIFDRQLMLLHAAIGQEITKKERQYNCWNNAPYTMPAH